jgi:hypothetical protein
MVVTGYLVYALGNVHLVDHVDDWVHNADSDVFVAQTSEPRLSRKLVKVGDKALTDPTHLSATDHHRW